MYNTNHFFMAKVVSIFVLLFDSLGLIISVLTPPPPPFRIASGTYRNLYSMAYRFLGMPLLACAHFMFHGK